ncbi:hypothetical protein HLPR_03760 [Helicovermis profundi]|uniref:Uncharacterized protein n=1 Tax=Helicovermis profundi TaxID=3065157 RepID=A0AAU9ENL1_9FIRM|nr:hypothetical protein HLPR_03760 [Clostridia bacterium S502]
MPRKEIALRYIPSSRNFFFLLYFFKKWLNIILKISGTPSIIEYKDANNSFELESLEISDGNTVFKSSIDIVRARKNPCHINAKYIDFFDLLIFNLVFIYTLPFNIKIIVIITKIHNNIEF